MTQYKYVEFEPKSYEKIFQKKGELYVHFNERFIETDGNLRYKIITLNKDGKARKKKKPLTKEQYKRLVKANEIFTRKRIEKQKRLKELRESIEKKLEEKLKGMGYDGKVSIKFFKELLKREERKGDVFTLSYGNKMVLQSIPEMMEDEDYRKELRNLTIKFTSLRGCKNDMP